MPRFPYQFFEEYVVRTPLFPHKNFRQKLNADGISDADFKEICSDETFQEAIYLASPDLHWEISQWLHSEKKLSSGQNQRLKNTILKYYTRMSTRCTPFGLFSGVGLGKFHAEPEIPKRSDEHPLICRDTKLDMHFLVSLAKSFEKTPEIAAKLLYFPNNSIYKVGKKIRYVEYEYNAGKRDYIISSAPLSEELEQVLDFTKHGRTISQIADILINDEITKDETVEFVEELIDNQVLVSELEPTVSGIDFLDRIISVLIKIEAKKEADILISIKLKLNHLDVQIGNPVSLYAEIEDLIKSFNADYEQKYLFQTDLYFEDEFTLPVQWKKEIRKALSFLNKITSSHRDTPTEKFKKAFSERFETQEMPLFYVLDTEIGIGYLQDQTAKGIHPYLENLQLPARKNTQNLMIELTPFQKILNEKVQESLIENHFIIELCDEDVKDLEENWNDIPDTISVMAEIAAENGDKKLCIGSVGGSSAANLLGRFCSEKSKVKNLAQQITEKEETLSFDKIRINSSQKDNSEILAEIIHLPEARIGNIIRRPTLRPYEIPYLAQSVVSNKNQIAVEDLFISVKNNRIVLRSKKLNREIKPYLTNAHNYHANSLPVYHFLSDLHSQNSRTGLYFSWGGLSHIHKFLPRIEYKNIILSKAQWNITEKDISALASVINDKGQFLSSLKVWRNKRHIPQWIQWTKSDNTLPMNLENYDMAVLFIQTLKNEQSITIEEFLYNENDDFKKEFIFLMHKDRNSW
ncbi:lantibiotic dehydratase family protein [Chryseobacterium chendengshani]|uniref:lantibiotic dehydratase family protein n=1 Tax=Chryseobacterium sp. LJ668 TaxID=2864040 RepID=UPI001C69173F|nr:lantibiotic dehydratase family protein [Chryseobacterium sp. LJ668]MBW8522218.1 lantibiotic dehydratase family protein [Chryseobacterium sp. LJ668]QYK17862.1 lantibiotic dehydratase family protein [Chryseobacterium sp. LJ668]